MTAKGDFRGLVATLCAPVLALLGQAQAVPLEVISSGISTNELALPKFPKGDTTKIPVLEHSSHS